MHPILRTIVILRTGSAKSGAGSGIRTREGLRHRVLSLEQASTNPTTPTPIVAFITNGSSPFTPPITVPNIVAAEGHAWPSARLLHSSHCRT